MVSMRNKNNYPSFIIKYIYIYGNLGVPIFRIFIVTSVYIVGYFCNGGATLPNDTICTVNHYCEEGSPTPTACPPGSFSDQEGNIAVENCDTCTPGYYCASFGISGPCAPGFFCPAGQSSATPANYSCTVGHYCPGETGLPVQCPAGTYQDETGQEFCKGCPVGRYVQSYILFSSNEVE